MKLTISSQFYCMQLDNLGQTTADVTLLFTWAVSDTFCLLFTYILLVFNALSFSQGTECEQFAMCIQNSVGGLSEYTGHHFNSKIT